MAPLQGIGVLVTRPEQQAAPLCRLLQAQGARTLRLPALDIKPLAGARIGALGARDIVVFTSANAVLHGASLLDGQRVATLTAIGPATARALSEHGHEVAFKPEAGFTSEALLAHAGLDHLAGRRIFLIKGSEGRRTLEQEFTRRGAHVITVEVYERVPATPNAAELAAVRAEFAAGRLQVITATSVDIGKHLLEFAPDDLRAEFRKALWLVPGQRVATRLRDLGLKASMLTAASAEDHDLVAALLRWRSSESDA